MAREGNHVDFVESWAIFDQSCVAIKITRHKFSLKPTNSRERQAPYFSTKCIGQSKCVIVTSGSVPYL